MTRIVTTHDRTKRPPPGCWRLMVSGLCVVIGLAVMGPAGGAENRFDGVYTVKRVLTKGSNQTCPPEDDVSIIIRGETLTFSNSGQQNLIIGFDPHPDGSFNQLSAAGQARQGYVVSIQGRVAGDAIDADVTDGRCEHHWHLVRTGPP